MTESHDPMCSVPLSYLTMLQERGDAERTHAITWNPGDVLMKPPSAIDNEIEAREAPTPAATMNYLVTVTEERDQALERIAEFEERAGCRLEHIPVEALNAAQDYSVNQQAIDTLKKENEALQRQVNAHASEACDWRGKFKEAARERDGLLKAAGVVDEQAAPWGVKKDGTPKKRPGRKVPRKRAA